MTEISLSNQRVTILMTGWDKFFCLKSKVSFAKNKIVNVSTYERNITPPWLKNPGTAIPGIIIAGTYQNSRNCK